MADMKNKEMKEDRTNERIEDTASRGQLKMLLDILQESMEEIERETNFIKSIVDLFNIRFELEDDEDESDPEEEEELEDEMEDPEDEDEDDMEGIDLVLMEEKDGESKPLFRFTLC